MSASFDALAVTTGAANLGEAGALLAQGKPRQALELAAALPGGAALAAAAALRLGATENACKFLAPLPDTARRTVLLGRAAYLSALDGHAASANAVQAGEMQPRVAALAEHACALARAEGDAPALIAAVTLLAEVQLLAGTDRFLPLRTLAEGLKVAEILGESADAHLLAVLAVAQCQSPRKAAQSAQKALERAQPGSPAQVGALLLLGRGAEALEQRHAGELDERWLRVFIGRHT